MKFMIGWSVYPGCHRAAAERFMGGGAPMPEGLKMIGRWHAPGSYVGWVLVEGDATAVAEHVTDWANQLDLEVTPVIEDAAAATAFSKVYGK